jgi:hypothetical protein
MSLRETYRDPFVLKRRSRPGVLEAARAVICFSVARLSAGMPQACAVDKKMRDPPYRGQQWSGPGAEGRTFISSMIMKEG